MISSRPDKVAHLPRAAGEQRGERERDQEATFACHGRRVSTRHCRRTPYCVGIGFSAERAASIAPSAARKKVSVCGRLSGTKYSPTTPRDQ